MNAVGLISGCAALAVAGPLSAAGLEMCKRITHPSHGGEAAHRDFGAGRVGYVEWWSMEGVYTDFVVADCAEDRFLRTRAREERISDRLPFDRTRKVQDIIETEMAVSPSLFSFERLADALDGVGRDIEIAILQEEPCACRVAYPEETGTRDE